jgi:hypothetical protein
MMMTNKKYLHEDITDSPEDQKKLKPDEATLDLPELKDIPGSRRSGEYANLVPGDTTLSSADEEGDELFENGDDLDSENVSPLEKKLLNESFDPAYDTDLPVNSISLDDKDNEGEFLDEKGLKQDLFGKDLDDDLIKEEDEESEGEGQQ